MTEKASALGGKGVWVAGLVVAAGVSIYALVASGVLDGGTETATKPPVPTSQSSTDTAASGTSSGEVPASAEATEPTVAQNAETAEDVGTEAPSVAADAGPSFDLVRVDAEGNTVIAGAAAPNTDLAILLDGVEIASAPVDGTGKFAAILSLEPSDAPRVLSLVERRAGADDLASDATVIVAPITSVATTPPGATPDGTQTAATDEIKPSGNTTQPAAAQAPAVILSDSEGVRVLQSAASTGGAEALPTAVSIDSISYSDTGAVMVSGRASVGLVVRLYLNNSLSAEAEVDDSGMWASQLSDVAGGLYEMRADEVDEGGKVTSRVLTPFKRETPETVALARAQTDAAAADTQAAATPETSETSATAGASDSQPPASDGTDAAPAPQTAVPAEQAETATETAQSTGADTSGSSASEASTPLTADAEATTATSEEGALVTAAAETTARPAVQIITVQPGSSLWAIARDNYGEGLMYLRVFEANKEKIANPDLIYPGQVFTVPEQ